MDTIHVRGIPSSAQPLPRSPDPQVFMALALEPGPPALHGPYLGA